jgi:hypothetical protein
MVETTFEQRGYTDLHEHIEELRAKGLLVEIDREINKDTEMHPLVRWQFRGGIDEEDRKAFLFNNITDSKGRKYDIPVLVCGLAGNQQIYQLGMRCDLKDLKKTWINAINNPIEPNLVDSADAPCHDIVFEGEDLLNGNGLDAIPVPISSPGWDNAPYFSAYRHPERRQLSRHGESAQPARHESVCRVAHRWLHALDGVEKTREADAGRCGHRRTTRGVVHFGAEGPGIAR